MTKEKLFETTSISLTSFLILKGEKPKADVNDLGLIAWYFEDNANLQNLISEYEDNALVGISDFNKTVAMLKRGMGHLNRNRRE